MKRVHLFVDPLCYCPPLRSGNAGPSIRLEEIARTRLLLTDDLCGLAGATRQLFAAAGLAIDAYPGRAMSYGALEDWVELGLGGAVVPRVHVRNKRRALSVTGQDGNPAGIAIDAVWRRDLLVATAPRGLAAYLQAVVPRLARGLATH